MKPYGCFAAVYDMFMSDTPYDEWTDYVEEIWRREGVHPHLVLDLACGTGNMTTRFASRGYDMIGLDVSEDMLAIAREKDERILYVCQDMTSFELYGTVDAIVCMCDGLNYVMDESALGQTFALVRNYLNPGGLFVFDLNTVYKYRSLLSNRTFADSMETAAYIWENDYDEQSMINEYDLDFFVKQADGRYARFEETHCQRAYETATVERLLAENGLSVLHLYGDDSFCAPTEKTLRLFFVVSRDNEGEM